MRSMTPHPVCLHDVNVTSLRRQNRRITANVSLVHNASPHPTSWRLILMLFTHQLLGLSKQQLNVIINNYYNKVKWSRYRTGVAQRVCTGMALLFHHCGSRRGLSGQQHAPAALYPRERPGTHCTGGWVGPRAVMDRRKISPLPGLDPGPPSP